MARLLTQLFEVTEQFDMQTQPQLLLLQKTMVVVEGVARTLNPNLNMWKTAEPVVRGWIERTLGPIGKLEEASESMPRFRPPGRCSCRSFCKKATRPCRFSPQRSWPTEQQE